MKKNTLKTIALASITLLVISFKPKKEDAPVMDKNQIKAEIQELETSYADVFNIKKNSTMNYYADDAISYSQNEPPLVGKLAINKDIQEHVDSTPIGSTVSFITNEVFPSSDGEQVVEIGSYRVRDSTDVITRSGNYMSLFVKRDGKYLCIRDMGASDMPKTVKK